MLSTRFRFLPTGSNGTCGSKRQKSETGRRHSRNAETSAESAQSIWPDLTRSIRQFFAIHSFSTVRIHHDILALCFILILHAYSYNNLYFFFNDYNFFFFYYYYLLFLSIIIIIHYAITVIHFVRNRCSCIP